MTAQNTPRPAPNNPGEPSTAQHSSGTLGPGGARSSTVIPPNGPGAERPLGGLMKFSGRFSGGPPAAHDTPRRHTAHHAVRSAKHTAHRTSHRNTQESLSRWGSELQTHIGGGTSTRSPEKPAKHIRRPSYAATGLRRHSLLRMMLTEAIYVGQLPRVARKGPRRPKHTNSH